MILLDEPTAFLDLPNRYELATLLRRLAHDEGKCILFSTHDLDVALGLCDAVALIDTPDLHCLPPPTWPPAAISSGFSPVPASRSTPRR